MHAISSLLLSFLGAGFPAAAPAQSPSRSPAEDCRSNAAGQGERSAWYAQVSAGIRSAECAFTPVAGEAGTWSAPNRSQELRSRVSKAGLEVFSRTTSADGKGAPWRLTLRTVGFGRVGDVRELDPAAVTTEGNRAQLDHGLLTEWFENGDQGIEQGWTIADRPRGATPLWIELEFGGDLDLRIDDSARSGTLADFHGTARMRYRDLRVFDARGRELEAWLRPAPIGGGAGSGGAGGGGAGIGIEIDDARALYPLTVDPVLSGPAWTMENNQIDSEFGAAVAGAGDVNGDGYGDVIVGAYLFDGGQLDEGRAYTFLGSASGPQLTASWIKESDQAGAKFGFAVAPAGDVNGDGYSDVIVGAHGFDTGDLDVGRAYAYLGSPTGLGASPAWTKEGDQENGYFGRAIATAGDVNGDGFSDVVIGAYLQEDGESSEGRAFAYFGSAGGLAASPSWTAEGNQANAFFGISVAAAGDVNGDGFADVIVGANSFDNGEAEEGRAFLYLGSLFGLSPTPDWTAESDQTGAVFGYSVAPAGDVNGDGYGDVIVGAQMFDNPQANEGRAFVYLGSATGPSLAPDWTAEGDQIGAAFGFSVSTAGDVNGDGFSDVVIGARAFDNGQTDEGRAFTYLGSPSGLETAPAWTAESGQPGAFYGNCVMTAGDVNGDGYSDVIVGANSYDGGQEDEGRAYAYLGSATGLAAAAAWTVESDQAGGAMGISVALAGDVNGDGYSDVIVGAHLADNGEIDEGRAYGFLGSASGLSTSPDWTAESDQASAFFGFSVAGAGDVNGDGYGDVIVGAYGYDNGETDEGRAYAYLGSSTGLAASPAWTVESDQAGSEFGNCVAGAGDVNGDSFTDVLVGARAYDNGQTNEGRAFAYIGSATGLATTAFWTAEADQANAALGTSVASAGDVNADGFGDVVVGIPGFDNGQTNEGRAYTYLGSGTGPATLPVWTAESNNVGAAFGTSVGTAGDINGDNFSDVIVGASLLDGGDIDEGRAYAYLGTAAGLSPGHSWTAEGNQGSAFFGASVATAGDVDGDGYSDVIVGAPGHDNGQTDEGRAYVYLGSSTGLAASAAWSAEGEQDGAGLGVSVAAAGDVDGDGYGDAIAGAAGHDDEDADEGLALVYLGNEARGSWTTRVQQRQYDDAAPIDLYGKSALPTLFRIRLSTELSIEGFRWASAGDAKARMQWQIGQLGGPLPLSPMDSGSEFDLGGSVLFNELVAFPVFSGRGAVSIPVGPHHWRVRLRTNNPFFPVTPWVSAPGNNETECKVWARRFTYREPR